MEAMMSVLLVAIAAGAGAFGGMRWRERRAFWKKSGIVPTTGVLPRLVRPGALIARRLAVPAAHLFSARRKEKTEGALASAGLRDELDAPSFLTLRSGAGFFGAALASMVLPIPTMASVVIGGALGWALPGAWLLRMIGRRRQAIERTLPGALDWLALSVEAGEGFAQALDRIAAKLPPGPLREDLGQLNADLRTGVPRRTALQSLARRANVPALSSFCALLIQADALGTSVGPVLRSVSQRLRFERFARAERQGIAAAQKALFPLILCIMPATFIVVFGPLIVRFVLLGPRMFLGG